MAIVSAIHVGSFVSIVGLETEITCLAAETDYSNHRSQCRAVHETFLTLTFWNGESRLKSWL